MMVQLILILINELDIWPNISKMSFYRSIKALIDNKLIRKLTRVPLHFWARGYSVSTVGLDEQSIRKYIREQENIEQRQQEFNFN